MSKNRKWVSKSQGWVQDDTRFAVIFIRDKETLCGNFRSPGAAWNAMTLDYVPNTGLIVVKTKNDMVLYPVNRLGDKIRNGFDMSLLPKDIWNRS